MHPRTEELLHYLDTQRAVLRAAVESVPVEHREMVREPGRWSVAGILEHLSRVEVSLARLFTFRLTEAQARGLGPEAETTPILATLGMEVLQDRTRRVVASEA